MKTSYFRRMGGSLRILFICFALFTCFINSAKAQCVADFSCRNRSGCAPFTTTLYDQSTTSEGIRSWSWTFTNLETGTVLTSSAQNPQMTFTEVGPYDVSLTVECYDGQDTKTENSYITVISCQCNADFYASDTMGCAPLTTTFYDNSDGAVYWNWSFPGGSPSSATGQGPHTVTYNTPGRYDVTLDIECTGGSDLITKEDYILARNCPSECEAAFDASPRQGCTPLTVNFSDQSTNAQSWQWNFPGGNPTSSTQQNPTVIYSNPGTYHVALKITCTDGQVDSLIMPNFITAEYCPSECEAAFDASPRQGCAPLTVEFTDQSTNAQSWYWKFPGGNPATSTQQNPTVVYSTPGTYSVSLKIICTNGQVDSLIQVDYIVVEDCGEDNASVGDWVWHDLNQNGLQESGEPGLDSVQVSLFDQNGNMLAMTLTDPNGFYMFSNLTPASYFLRFSLRPGFTFTLPDQGTDDTIDSDAQPGSGDTPVFTLGAGEHNTTMDAGMYQPEGDGEVLGHKWHDLNDNGLRDAGEPGIANWEIILDYNQDGVLDPSVDWITTTDANGDYKFTGYFNGDYFIGEIQQSSWQQTYPDTTFASHLGNVAPYDHWFYVSPNQAISGLDFGNIQRDEEYDFGDAPDPSYPTLLTSNGARHVIKQGFHLGAGADAEPNGYQSTLSDGDDVNPTTGPDDEDGVTMSPFISPGQFVPITVVASDTGVINAWIDFNRNGNWADAGEHFIPAMPVYPGSNLFTMNVPASAQYGPTYVRFRFSSIRQLSYDGLAPDGEVEDYAVEIVEGDNGSITIIKDATPKDNTPFLMCVELSGSFFNMLCTTLFDPLSNKWTFLNPYQVDAATEAIVPGWTLTDITVTGDIDNGSTVNVATGRVDVDYDPGENIVITFKNKKQEGEELFDFGDAPDPTYPTLLTSNGARHVISPNLFLGSNIDAEPNGQPSATALGDDQGILYSGVPFPAGDEDGVQLPPIITHGSTVQVNVFASAPGALNAWFDFNRNGSWADPGEHIIPAMPVVAGINTFSFTVPASAVIGQSYARFRLSSARNISFDGLAPDGEVEDYAVAIQREGDGGNLTIIKDANPKDNTPFWISVVYGIHGGAAPYRDPMMNTSSITNGPAGIYSVGETIPAGWTLTDIIVTGDADNGSNIDVSNSKVDVDLDAGENITVVFKNEKTGEEELFDLGDASDGSNHSGLPQDAYPGIPANYPTVFDPATGLPPGPRHLQPKADAWLGPNVSLELDADLMPDMDGLTNIDPPNNAADFDHHDDGVHFPIALPKCQQTWFNYTVTIPPGNAGIDRYVNVWFDWNRDGDWADVFTCEQQNDAPEWAVQNRLIPGTLSPGSYVFATPTFRAYHTADAINKPVWMRITIAETTAPTPTDGRGTVNGYRFGETEDYYFFPEDTTGERNYDFGDAPDAPNAPRYPTLHANGGAYHDIVDGFHLGGLIDDDTDGQPTPDALGDDNDGMDDEDGVMFSTPLIPGQSATVDVHVSANGILNAWIDFDGNNSWMDADDHVFIDVALSAGANNLTFNVPASAITGPTFARFRLSRVLGIMSTGYGLAGEVEDYEVHIGEESEGSPIKWPQIPLLNEDPDMPHTPHFRGWDARSEYDGTFVADDWFCKSARPVTDIHWWGSYTDWDTTVPPPIAPYAFHIGVWTDVPKGEDRDYSHPGEMIWEWIVPRDMLNERVVGDDFHPEFMSKPDTCFRYDFFIPEDQWFHQEKDSMIYWLSIAAIYEEVPDEHVWGWKTREHFFHDDAVYIYEPIQPTVGDVIVESEPMVEGWDLAFVLTTTEPFMEFDFGDAPFERYPTLFEHNGALHIIDPNVYLGDRIDPEPDGQPNHTSTGDDNDGSDDDDGILFTAPTGGTQATHVEVTASRPGYLNAWMDFHNNGSWDEPEDHIFRDELIPGGQSILGIPIPDDAVAPPYFSRFRFSTEPGLYYVGIAIDGEVEDYYADLIVTDVQNPTQQVTTPTAYYLYQNYPNPFNATTEICYDLPRAGHVSLSVYNLMGVEQRLLVNEHKTSGNHITHWDGKDKYGRTLPSGIYFYQLQTSEFNDIKKLILLK